MSHHVLDSYGVDGLVENQCSLMRTYPRIKRIVGLVPIQNLLEDFQWKLNRPGLCLVLNPRPKFRNLVNRVVGVAGCNQYIRIEEEEHGRLARSSNGGKQWFNVPSLDAQDARSSRVGYCSVVK